MKPMNARYAAAMTLAACVGLGAASAMGASATWDGGATPDTSWATGGTGGNWSGAAAPGDTAGGASTTTDYATFGAGTNTTVSVDANRAIGGLTFTSTSANYTFNGPGTLYVQHPAGFGGNTAIDGSNASTITFNTPVTFKSGDYRFRLGTGQTINFQSTVTAPSGQTLWLWKDNGTLNYNAPLVSTNSSAANVRFVGSTPGTVNFNVSNVVGVTPKPVAISSDTGSLGIFNLKAASVINSGNINSATGTVNVTAADAITGTSTVSIGTGYSSGKIAYGQFNFGNTYTGATSIGNTGNASAADSVFEIANGITGSATGTGNVTITKATLEGAGAITNSGASKGVELKAGSVLAPGDTSKNRTSAIGTMTLSLGDNGLNLSALGGTNAGSLVFDLDTTNDLVKLTAGTLNIGTGLNWDDFAFNLPSSTLAAGTYTLFDTASTISGTLGSNLSGTLDGKTATLSLADGGKDIVLTVVPEPATLGLLAIGGLGLLARRRRTA